MKFASFIALILAIAFSASSRANTESPPGLGQAGAWVTPCSLLDKKIKLGGKLLPETEEIQSSLCLGAFTGIMAVNYISPPLLPFCIGDDDSAIDYVRIYLRFMRGHPEFYTKNFGLMVMTALGQAHPKSECT
jgi:hypothetical protein